MSSAHDASSRFTCRAMSYRSLRPADPNSGRRHAARDHPVAQPGADGAADEVAGEHGQAEVEPVAEAAGGHTRERARAQADNKHGEPARGPLRGAVAALDHRDPAHAEAE